MRKKNPASRPRTPAGCRNCCASACHSPIGLSSSLLESRTVASRHQTINGLSTPARPLPLWPRAAPARFDSSFLLLLPRPFPERGEEIPAHLPLFAVPFGLV